MSNYYEELLRHAMDNNQREVVKKLYELHKKLENHWADYPKTIIPNIPDIANMAISERASKFLSTDDDQQIKKFYPKCEITLIDRNRFKLVIGQKYGALPQWIGDKESWDKFLAENENKFDRVVEFAGAAETFSAAIHIASPSGRVIWAGNISDDLTLPKSQVSSILRKEITIMGTWNSIYKGVNACDWTESLGLISKGLKPSELVSLRIDLDEISETLRKLYAHKNRDSKFEVIKVLVKPNG